MFLASLLPFEKKKKRNKKQPSSLKSHESRSKRMKSFAPCNLLSALRDYYCYSWPRKSIRGILISLKEEGGSGLHPLLIISAILLAGQLLPATLEMVRESSLLKRKKLERIRSTLWISDCIPLAVPIIIRLYLLGASSEYFLVPAFVMLGCIITRLR